MMVCEICMLRLLHDVGTIFTIFSYELGTILCLLMTVNMQFYIIEIIAFEFVFRHLLYGYSLRFFASLLTLHFWVSFRVHISLRLFASQICSPFTICHSFLFLNWKVGLEPGPTYLSWSNMFFYNCYPCNQILYLCSIKVQSFWRFLCN